MLSTTQRSNWQTPPSGGRREAAPLALLSNFQWQGVARRPTPSLPNATPYAAWSAAGVRTELRTWPAPSVGIWSGCSHEAVRLSEGYGRWRGLVPRRNSISVSDGRCGQHQVEADPLVLPERRHERLPADLFAKPQVSPLSSRSNKRMSAARYRQPLRSRPALLPRIRWQQTTSALNRQCAEVSRGAFFRASLPVLVDSVPFRSDNMICIYCKIALSAIYL
ncbi:hypothetical protein ACVI1T_004639 [Rhizobium redzepovicii]